MCVSLPTCGEHKQRKDEREQNEPGELLVAVENRGEGAGEMVKVFLECVNVSSKSYVPGPGEGPGGASASKTTDQ